MAVRIDTAVQCFSAFCTSCSILMCVWQHSARRKPFTAGTRLAQITERAVWSAWYCQILYSHKIPADIARTPGSPWFTIPAGTRRRWCRDRKQRGSCRAGVWVRLCKQPHKPPLPSISSQMQAAFLLITETWLHLLLPNTGIKLAGHMAHKHDKTKARPKEGGCASMCTTAGVPTQNQSLLPGPGVCGCVIQHIPSSGVPLSCCVQTTWCQC